MSTGKRLHSRKVEQLLERAGLQASPFDRLSLQALEDYLNNGSKQESSEMVNSSLDQIDIYSPRNSDMGEGERRATAAPTMSREDRLLEQMSLQTSLILDLQRRINALSDRVKYLESNGPNTEISRSSASKDAPNGKPSENGTSTQTNTGTPEAAVQDRAANARDGGRLNDPAPVPGHRQSRFIRLLRVYTDLRRRDVPNFQWGIVFKAAIIMGILFSRLGSDEDGVPLRFYALATFLIGILLLQTGYAQFLYQFLVENNYVYRVLILNEDVAVAPAAPPVPQRADDDNGWFDWRETFLGGRIHRDDPDQQQAPAIVRFFKEVFLLTFSFVLSIFPMWHPEPDPPFPHNDADDGEEDDDRAVGDTGAIRAHAEPDQVDEDDASVE